MSPARPFHGVKFFFEIRRHTDKEVGLDLFEIFSNRNVLALQFIDLSDCSGVDVMFITLPAFVLQRLPLVKIMPASSSASNMTPIFNVFIFPFLLLLRSVGMGKPS